MKPKVGMSATILYPTDRYPYLVTYVSKNGYKIQLTGIDTNELTRQYNKTGFPISDYILTDKQLKDVKLTKEVKFAYSEGELPLFTVSHCAWRSAIL